MAEGSESGGEWWRSGGDMRVGGDGSLVQQEWFFGTFWYCVPKCTNLVQFATFGTMYQSVPKRTKNVPMYQTLCLVQRERVEFGTV